jgi:tRNA pseudouridine32 synthase/23S rRNA pseudouridine746 synthase
MATSGLMLMARGADVQRTLSTAFETRQVHKRYVAVVQGRPAPTDATGKTDEGWSVIDAPIRVDWPHRPLRIIDAAGQPSVTRWRVAADAVPAGTDASTQPTRLDLEPVTGRSHQLRVHLRHIGHPILGDMLYAPPEVQALAPRLLLHASVLQFSHPASGAALRFESPAPF